MIDWDELEKIAELSENALDESHYRPGAQRARRAQESALRIEIARIFRGWGLPPGLHN